VSPARHLLSVAGAAYRVARSIASRTPSRLSAFAALSLVATWPLLATATALNEFRDAHVLSHYEAIARDSVLRWHQAPLWDPYYCGGMYLLGTPQARFVSPTFLLTLAFGEARGEALAAFAMIAIGLEGAFRYAASRRATRFASFVAAPAFALSGLFALTPALGWINFFGFELLPWIALGVRRSLDRERAGVAMTAIAAATCVGFGGTYALPLAAIWCAFEVAEFVARNALRRRARLTAGLGVAVAGAILAAGLSAVRLWPVAETLLEAPRVIGGTPGSTPEALLAMAFSPLEPKTENGSFYIGALVAPAAILALLRRRAAPLVGWAGLSAWLAAGYAAHPSLFGVLRELPVYAVLRYPERFLVLTALALASLAAEGVTRAESWARTTRAKPWLCRLAAHFVLLATVGALVANVGPLVSVHWAQAAGRTLAAQPEAVPGPFHQSRGTRWGLAYYAPMQRGSLSCWEAYPVPQSPLLRGDLVSEERVLEPDAGTVIERAWSPNAIDLDVELSRPATVVVNQNWHRGWRASAGEVKSEGGLLAVALGAGTHSVRLLFAPRSATGGVLVTLVALVATASLLRRARTDRRIRAGREGAALALAVAAPCVPLLLTLAVHHEPSAAVPLSAFDGRPVIAEGLDEGVPRLDAKLSGGILLEAATLSTTEPLAGDDLTLELDWRRLGADVPRGAGIFVHLEPSKGDGMNGDHALVSSVLDLEDAPPGKTLRDVLPVHVPEDSSGKRWKIWVGLWLVRRGGKRVPVVESGHAIVNGDRILAGSFLVR
jgi:hypothetical protein